MDWITILTKLSVFVIGIPAVSVLAYYIAKHFIDGFFKARSAQFEHELALISQRDNIRFSTLHAERAKVTKDLYLLIVAFHDYCIDYISLDGKGSSTQLFINSRSDVQTCYRNNKLFFSEQLCKDIEEIINVGKSAVSEKAQSMQNPEQMGIDKLKKDMVLINKLTPNVLHKLEREFRILLGVETT